MSRSAADATAGRPAITDRPRRRHSVTLGIRGRFTVAIAGTVAVAVVALVVLVGALSTRTLRDGHDLALQREATRVASLINTRTEYVASGTCEYAVTPACTAVIDATTPPGASVMGIPITGAQLAATGRGHTGAHAPDAAPGAGSDHSTAIWSNASIPSSDAGTSVHLRVLTVPLDDGRALVTASPTTAVDRSIDRLIRLLASASIATILGAAIVSAYVAGRTVRPILRLTEAAEHVISTGGSAGRVALPRRDEIGRLAIAIDDMLTRLDRSEATRRHLIEDASHDLRSPLTALSTNLELLTRDDLPGELHTRLVRDAGHETADMARLVQNITDLAGAGDTPLPNREYSPAEAVQEAVAAARRRWHRVRFDVDDRITGGTTATGDHDLLVRAIVNLLDNAAKYGPGADATVLVCAGDDIDVLPVSPARTWWVSVTDTGPGISIDALPHVFDRAYRADGALRQAGSGIGLAMAKQTAERHGGTVVAASAAAKDDSTDAADHLSGTTMTLRAPCAHPTT